MHTRTTVASLRPGKKEKGKRKRKKKRKSINNMERLELRLRAEAAGCALTQQVHARCTATQRGWGGMSACEGERVTGLGGRW